MASVGRIIASAFSLNPEIQASLASINFDFSLLKVEAAAEYLGVGHSLTTLRRRDAEDGSSHITARKLVALFESEIPSTPKLFAAYGHRATEISGSPVSNPQGTAAHGAFKAHVGADGTTVWAAATSGKEALALHLLACMLARIWPADEAVSIWFELVKVRGAQLRDQIESGHLVHASSLFASRAEIQRSQLAEWDASARAWLSSADRVKTKQHLHLRQVISYFNVEITSHSNLYDSVMQTWIGTMNLMEELLNGKAQRVEDGALLLGLSAWHIYPDLSLTTDKPTYIAQHDDLVPQHALITFGLLNSSTSSGSGVHWSLPLANLRYYGRPVVRKRFFGLSNSRVPFDDLIYVALGSMFCSWQISENDVPNASKLMRVLSDSFVSIAPWMARFDQACTRYSQLRDDARTYTHCLISSGFRHSATFLGTREEHPVPVFGLTDIVLLLKLCWDADGRIKLLRYWARKHLHNRGRAIIRYFMPESSVERFALVEPEKNRKRKHESRDVSLPERHPEYWVHEAERHKFAGHKNLISELNVGYSESDIQEMLGVGGEDLGDIVETEDSTFYFPYNNQIRPYSFIAGDIKLAAIYCPGVDGRDIIRPAHRPFLNYTSLLSFFNYQLGKPASKELLPRLAQVFWHDRLLISNGEYMRSIQALDWAHHVYRHLPEAHVDLRVRERPLHTAFFFPPHLSKKVEFSGVCEHDLQRTFSCLSYFETGFVNLKPTDLDNAMAVCYQDSLYVAKRLLQDPATNVESCAVTRIVGNIGKPGLCILHPPLESETREFDVNTSWHLANYRDFDGKYEDNFTTTSLHLRFTGASHSFGSTSTGDVHRDVHFVETLVQAFDKRDWIADLDIFGALAKVQMGWPSKMFNRHSGVIQQKLCTIDTWDELLDAAPCHAIFRGHGNWMARLAAAAILTQRNRDFRIISCDDAKPEYMPPAERVNGSRSPNWADVFGPDPGMQLALEEDELEVRGEEVELSQIAVMFGTNDDSSPTPWSESEPDTADSEIRSNSTSGGNEGMDASEDDLSSNASNSDRAEQLDQTARRSYGSDHDHSGPRGPGVSQISDFIVFIC